MLAGIYAGGSRETFYERMLSQVAALAQNSDGSGVRTDLAVGLSSSAEIPRAGMVATTRDRLRDSLVLAVASDDKLGADQEHIVGVLRKAAGPAFEVPA